MILNKFRGLLSHMAAVTSTLLIVSCAMQDIDDLHHTPRKGSEFAQELATQYETLAKRDNRKSSLENASYFAVKGMHAARGEEVSPENPKKWENVSEEILPKLMQKRLHLVSLLDKGGRWKMPKEAAAAQAGFDCMVSEQTPCGCCPDDTAMCRDMFDNNLKSLEGVMPSYTVQFEESKSDITAEGTKMLNQVANAARAMPQAKIHIMGFTDPEGGWKGNLVLSQNRANSVAKVLTQMGIDKDRLHAVGKGEIAGPKVMPENRKVVVYIH